MDKEELKIVFFGTPQFAVESLSKLVESGFNIAAVVTMPDKEGGRGKKLIESDVKKFAIENNLCLLQPTKLKEQGFLEKLQSINADLFIVIAFRMLPEVVWSMPRFGTFNLHASLLPKYRGAAPINRAIMNGENETGVTTFFLNHEIDTGDIVGSKKVEISDSDTAGTIHDKLMVIGADMVIETVNNILDGTIKTHPQPEGEFTPAPKIFREDCRIDWNKNSRDIFNLIRGLSPSPAAFSTMVDKNGKMIDLKIFKSSIVLNDDLSQISFDVSRPADIHIFKKRLFVSTRDGLLEILSLQPAGKKRMDAAQFLLGYQPIRFI